MENLIKRNGKTTSEPNEGQERIIDARYRLGQKLGKGGNARVYYATDLKYNRPVALKLFFRELGQDPLFVARFRKEVKIASSLRHTNIVRTLNYGYDDERYYLVMDYVNGGNLQDLIRRNGPQPLSQVVAMVGQLCDALEYAHGQGIIHRDIKPQNVLIDSKQHVRLADFGLARAVASTGLTVTGPTIGTIGYLAPEQIQNAPLTARTDIYALGVMMFEMVTGRLPFENASALAVALAHVQQEPPLPRIYNPQVSPGLELVIRRCMAKDPARRFANVSELKAALIKCLSDEASYRVEPAPLKPAPVEANPKPAQAEKSDFGLQDVISLPTALQQLPGKLVEAAPVESKPDRADATTDYRLPDAVTPKNNREHTLSLFNTSTYFLRRSKKARWLTGALVGVALLGMALLALFVSTLVTQAQEQSGSPATILSVPTATVTVARTTTVTVATSTTSPTKSAATPTPAATAPGLKVGGTLSGVNIWRVQDSPVLVTEELVVGPDAALTIEPGVIVKFSPNVNLRVEGGKLKAVGTAEQPISFTSAQEQPQAGDWGGLVINQGGTLQLFQAEISYGGSADAPLFDPKHPALLVTGARLEMSGVKITRSAGAGLIVLGKSSGYVTASVFSGNTDYQVYLDNRSVTFSNNKVDGKSKL